MSRWIRLAGCLLAAIERAARHEQSADESLVVIGQHLGFVRAAATTRRLQVDELTSSGAVRHSSPGGKVVWGLTSAGRRRLMRARRAGKPLALLESRSAFPGASAARLHPSPPRFFGGRRCLQGHSGEAR